MPIRLEVNENIPPEERCEHCHGSGYTTMCHINHASYHRCWNCGGSGRKQGSFDELLAKMAERKEK